MFALNAYAWKGMDFIWESGRGSWRFLRCHRSFQWPRLFKSLGVHCPPRKGKPHCTLTRRPCMSSIFVSEWKREQERKGIFLRCLEFGEKEGRGKWSWVTSWNRKSLLCSSGHTGNFLFVGKAPAHKSFSLWSCPHFPKSPTCSQCSLNISLWKHTSHRFVIISLYVFSTCNSSHRKK